MVRYFIVMNIPTKIKIKLYFHINQLVCTYWKQTEKPTQKSNVPEYINFYFYY